MYQGNYNATLVAQGAFSAYITKEVKEVGGWQPCVGEDIVLTWTLLEKGYKVNFAQDAIVFTQAPETWKDLFRQRKRWARGMIEALKKRKRFYFKKIKLEARIPHVLESMFPIC